MRWLSGLLLLIFFKLTSAQYDSIYTIASSWSMWSAWSACAPEGVMIRVRACSTVRGFKCVGRNKEFKSCELRPPAKGDEDFDQVDEDREIAMRQLYQDYDLRGDTATSPTRPPANHHLQTIHPKHPVLPPGRDIMVVAPPGHRHPVVPDQPTEFRGDFKSFEDETTQVATTARRSMPPMSSFSAPQPSQSLDFDDEELMEEEVDDTAATSRNNPNFQTIQPPRQDTVQYTTQPPTTTTETTTTFTTTTPPTTTAPVDEDNDEEEVEVPLDETDDIPEQTELNQSIEPLSKRFEFEEDTDPEFVQTVRPELRRTTTDEPITTTSTTTTATTTEPPPSVPGSFDITEDSQVAEEELPVFVTPRRLEPQEPMNFPRIHGRTMKQQLPTILGIHQPNVLGMLPPASPPRIPTRIQNTGEVEAIAVAKNKLTTLRRKKKLSRKLKNKKKRKGATPPVEEQLVTGDTARALNWLIANMTSSIGDAVTPISDKVVLEKYVPREQRRKQSKIRFSNWSIWSECQCGLQSRKRICLPSSDDDSVKCPLPQIEERECSSDICL